MSVGDSSALGNSSVLSPKGREETVCDNQPPGSNHCVVFAMCLIRVRFYVLHLLLVNTDYKVLSVAYISLPGPSYNFLRKTFAYLVFFYEYCRRILLTVESLKN